MKITLNKALKLKNKLIRQVTLLARRMNECNSYQEPNKPAYDSRSVMEEYRSTSQKLVLLKVAINAANQPIMKLIASIPELKSTIAVFQALNTTSEERMSGYPQVVVKYIAVISETEKDQIIEKLTAELEDIQDEIDKHNATTEIEVE